MPSIVCSVVVLKAEKKTYFPAKSKQNPALKTEGKSQISSKRRDTHTEKKLRLAPKIHILSEFMPENGSETQRNNKSRWWESIIYAAGSPTTLVVGSKGGMQFPPDDPYPNVPEIHWPDDRLYTQTASHSPNATRR